MSYVFDWGDGTNSGWTEYVPSGTSINISHTWTKKGSFNIRAKAKDSHGTESRWSESLSVSMPRNKINDIPIFSNILQRLQKVLPFLFNFLY